MHNVIQVPFCLYTVLLLATIRLQKLLDVERQAPEGLGVLKKSTPSPWLHCGGASPS
jgi:hypothetical protein